MKLYKKYSRSSIIMILDSEKTFWLIEFTFKSILKSRTQNFPHPCVLSIHSTRLISKKGSNTTTIIYYYCNYIRSYLQEFILLSFRNVGCTLSNIIHPLIWVDQL